MGEAAWQAHIDAYEQTLRSTLALGHELGTGDWDRPTDCPGWSVKDQYSHILGVERFLVGDTDDGVRRTVANTAIDVEASRGRAPGEILADLADVIDRRFAALRSGAVDLAEVIDTPLLETMVYGEFMRFRVLDIWMHEQDVRRAVARPGNTDGPAAELSRQMLGRALLAAVGVRAAAVPGQAVVVETPDRRWCVEIGDDRRPRFRDTEAEATVRLRMAWDTFIRLGGGRVGVDDAEVEIAGDRDLARRVLAGMAVTP